MSKGKKLPDNQITIYQIPDGNINIEVLYSKENVWLSQKRMAELFDCSSDNISLHLKNIYKEKELDEAATAEDFSVVQKEGNREITRKVTCYSLEAVIAVGYRVNSERGTQFRQWAISVLQNYIHKGFAIDRDRFKYGSRFSTRFFDDLLEEIRDIRSSERMAYQKITDIYATSIDYSLKAEDTKQFFATVQNKLHFAITGQTAAEIVAQRADSKKPNMGLTSWRKGPHGKILPGDVCTAKNYLGKEELDHLNRIVAMYLDYAELQAVRNKPMFMRDWIEKLNAFLKFSEYENAHGRTEEGSVKVIDFTNPDNNDFLAVTQLWIKGDRYPRRPDMLIYINGLPLVFIELKNSNVKVQNAYDDNLINYKHDIPLLFNYNAFCILSNGLETKVGSFTAGYGHFFSWLRPDDEAEKVNKKSIEHDGTSLERVVHGLLPKERLLDYIENFILYYNDSTKIVAQNHQFIGVNKAINSFQDREAKKGKLGVFWHTQGSGKSFSMIFIVRKIFHKFTGNYTFVIITDREELDGQIYRNFLYTNTVNKSEAAQPKDSAEMREFLGRNMRLVFTLIHKFRIDKGREYPKLSDRDDIIVIVDEAHRTQYASLAENMRKGLPNAQYFAFTGTPILGKGDQLYQGKTYAWFGGYVSQYNFVQSIDDGATVPLFYQKRVPEVLIQNANLSDEFYQILDEANLDEKTQEKLEKEYSTELEVIKRDDRLETIAKDIVAHFPNRGYLGKGMVVSVDKFTSVKMYDKVQEYWKKENNQKRENPRSQ